MTRLALLSSIALICCGDNEPRPLPPCDFTEQTHDLIAGSEPTTSEASGLTQPPFTLCGQVDPGQPTAQYPIVDFDKLSFDLPAGDYTIRVFAPDAPPDVTIEALAWQAKGFRGWTAVTDGEGVGLVWGRLEPATNELWLEAHGSSSIEAPFEYRVQVVPIDLATLAPDPGGAADFAEHADGADSLANDVITYTWPPVYGLSPSPADAPEETGLVLAAGDIKIIEGTAGVHPKTDLYYDHDTFAFDTADDVHEVHARLLFDDAAEQLDLDLFMLEPSPDGSSVRALASAQQGLPQGPDPLTTILAPATRNYLTVTSSVMPMTTQTTPRPYRVVLHALD